MKKIVKLIITIIFIVIILGIINLISFKYFNKTINVQFVSIVSSTIAGYFILSYKSKKE